MNLIIKCDHPDCQMVEVTHEDVGSEAIDTLSVPPGWHAEVVTLTDGLDECIRFLCPRHKTVL